MMLSADFADSRRFLSKRFKLPRINANRDVCISVYLKLSRISIFDFEIPARGRSVGQMSCHQDAVCPILSNGVKTAPVPPRREAEDAGGAHRAVVALAAAAILVAGAAAFFVFRRCASIWQLPDRLRILQDRTKASPCCRLKT